VTLVFAVSGLSGSGKTALVESIIRGLLDRGYTVASAKSSIHNPTDKVGSDTWRHRQAGAELTVFFGPKETQVNYGGVIGLKAALLGREFDFLIVEGMKSSMIPKVWCTGDQEYAVDSLPPNTIAVVGWDSADIAASPGPLLLRTKELERILNLVIEHAAELQALTDV
jgi:molybdopterin-guanine dinucleotide biosynthesis protein B